MLTGSRLLGIAALVAALAAPAAAQIVNGGSVSAGGIITACGATTGQILFDNSGTCAGSGATTDTTGDLAVPGQITTTTGLPTIASGACGATTNGAIVAGSTNQAGNLTIGAATTTTCTVSFSATLASAPKACVIFPTNATAAATGTTVARVSSVTASQFVITGSALASSNYEWICL